MSNLPLLDGLNEKLTLNFPIMLKVMVIDHEQPTFNSIEETLRSIKIKFKVFFSHSPCANAQKIFTSEQPDLVLINLSQNAHKSLQLLATVNGLYKEVIFISKQIHHALDAVKWKAFDFILWRLEKSAIQEVVKNAVIHILENGHSSSRKYGIPGKLVLPIRNGHKILESKTVLLLKADSGYTHVIRFSKKPLLISKKLGWIQEHILDEDFIRIHRSYIINKAHVCEVHRNDGGAVLLSNGLKIPVSPKYKSSLDKMLTTTNKHF